MSHHVWMIVVLAAGAFVTGCSRPADKTGAGSASACYTRGAAPTGNIEELPLQQTASQYGITWTFAQPARVGRFVNGDFYVVGPVTLQSVDPKTLVDSDVPANQLDTYETRRINTLRAVRNGSMLDPPARQAVAFDSGCRNWFHRELLATYPVHMKPGDSLVSTISLKLDEPANFPYHSGGRRDEGDNCPVKLAAVLSCVAAPLPPDAFRPGYCDRSQTIYLARDLRRDLLPKLAKVPGAPDPEKFADIFQKPWINLGFFGFDQPMENMPHYGQWVGQSVGDAALLLCMDYTPAQKERLLIHFTQVGIDYWGMVKSGHPGWEGWGGHGSGRKLPIVFAGYLLGDPQMTAPTKAFPDVLFGEDNQTRYGHAWTRAHVVFAGHSGMHGNTVPQPPRGPYEHLDPSEWDKNGQSNFVSEAYRRANTSCCWVGQALAIRLLSLEKDWNHNAFLDYVDRWMYEDDAPARKAIAPFASGDTAEALRDPEKDWFHEGYAGDDWVKTAWNDYRTRSFAPTDGWTKDRGEQAAMFGPNPATTPHVRQPAPPPASPAVPDPAAATRTFLTLNLDDTVTMKLVQIPAGKFLMGSPKNESGRLPTEDLPHKVAIDKPFYMAITEVTQEQYQDVMGTNPAHFKGKNNPVECVSWNDAEEFCRKLSAKTGRNVRLPAETQWEYACRAGTSTPFSTGDTIISDKANFDGTQPYPKSLPGPFRRETTPVGTFAPNPFGLYDMHGNVAEWCADEFTDHSPGAGKAHAHGASLTGRILRGGAWCDGPDACRSASRYWLRPDAKQDDFGFRVVVSP